MSASDFEERIVTAQPWRHQGVTDIEQVERHHDPAQQDAFVDR